MGCARLIRAHVSAPKGPFTLHLHPSAWRNSGPLGFDTIMFGRDGQARRLEVLIDEIDVIKWSGVPPQNRALPDHACDTYLSITGNWAAFDAEAWESQMEDDMYLIPDEWGAKAFDHPRGSLTGLIDRRAEEKRTTRPARAGDETAVPERYRLLELDAPAGEVVCEAPETQEEGTLRFPNVKAQRRLARTLDQFMVKSGVKPLITEYGYPEGLTLDNVIDIVRLHLGTCVSRGPTAGPGTNAFVAGPSVQSSVKVEGLPLRSGISIRAQKDQEEQRRLQVKAEAAVGKEEALPLPPTPAIAPRACIKPAAKEAPRPVAGPRANAGAAANRRLDIEVVNLLSDDEDAVMTDAES